MDVPQGHPLDAAPRAFLVGVRRQIRKMFTEEILALSGVTVFQLALKIQVRKDKPDGAEECTDSVLHHKLLQVSVIHEALGRAFPAIHERLEK